MKYLLLFLLLITSSCGDKVSLHKETGKWQCSRWILLSGDIFLFEKLEDATNTCSGWRSSNKRQK